MQDEQFLSLLCCPISKLPLKKGEAVMVSVINSLIHESKVRNQAGVVPAQLDAVLVTLDNRYAYPVRHGVPILLADEAIRLVDKPDTPIDGSSCL